MHNNLNDIKMNNKKVNILIILTLIVIFINLNTELTFSDPDPRYGGTLIDSSTTDAQMFNPVLSSDSASSNIESFLFQGMMTYDKDMSIVPELANNWEISTNKLDYTFFLRDDVKWHDGETFTADDVIFTWDRILDPETDTTRDSMFDLLDLENVPYEKIDDYTVIFHLKTTFSPMMNNMMFSIIPEHGYLNHDGVDGIKHTVDDCRDTEGVYTFNDDPTNKDPTGTGSMMFFEWEIDDHITLIRNSVANGGPGNWREHDTYLDRYILRIISDVNVQFLALQAGEIDMMDLSSTSQEDIKDLIADPDINVYSSPTFTSDHIAFQTDPSKGNLYGSTSRDFTSNPNHFAGYKWQTAEKPDIYGHLVRQALNYAIDKQGLIDYAYPQGSRNLGPMYLAQYEWYNDQVESYNYNLTKANELLDYVGFGSTADDPLRSELDFKISYNQGGLRRNKVCVFARDQWANLGIDVEIENLEWVSMLSTHYDGRNFDAMNAGWTGGGGDPDLTGVWSSRNIMPDGKPIGLNPDGTWLWSGYPREGGLNYMSYWNPTADILMDIARTEETFSVRKTYYDQIQEIIVNDSPYVWLLAHVNMIAVDVDFHGFVQDSVAGFWPEPVGFRNIFYESSAISDGLEDYYHSEENENWIVELINSSFDYFGELLIIGFIVIEVFILLNLLKHINLKKRIID